MTGSSEPVGSGGGVEAPEADFSSPFLALRPEMEPDLARVLVGGVASAAEGALDLGDLRALRDPLDVEPPLLGVVPSPETALEPSSFSALTPPPPSAGAEAPFLAVVPFAERGDPLGVADSGILQARNSE